MCIRDSYYGTDTRMYSLMALEAILWYLAVRRALELPSRGRVIALGAVTAALMYTLSLIHISTPQKIGRAHV